MRAVTWLTRDGWHADDGFDPEPPTLANACPGCGGKRPCGECEQRWKRQSEALGHQRHEADHAGRVA